MDDGKGPARSNAPLRGDRTQRTLAAAIRAEGLGFGYGTGPLFEDLSLTVEKGRTLAVVGASGTGKTTLLHLVAGLLRPASGRVLLDGEQATAGDPRVGFMFQHYALLPWYTAGRNVALGLRFRGVPRRKAAAAAGEALALVGLAGFDDRAPDELSGGEKQRAALARTLVLDPQLLVLDEPFAAIDTMSREALQDLLSQIWLSSGKTTILVTHSVEEASFLADRVLVLHRAPGGAAIPVEPDLGDTASHPRAEGFRLSSAFFERCRRIRQALETVP